MLHVITNLNVIFQSVRTNSTWALANLDSDAAAQFRFAAFACGWRQRFCISQPNRNHFSFVVTHETIDSSFS